MSNPEQRDAIKVIEEPYKEDPEYNGNCPDCGGNMYLVHGEEGDPEFLAQCEKCQALFEIE